MTSESISQSSHTSTADRRRAPIYADLLFWSVAGAAVAAWSGPLSDWWNAPRTVLLAGGLGFLAGGVGMLLGLSRVRPIPRRLVLGFAMFNLAFAPIMWATAGYGWLPLRASGDWALAFAGDVALVLGVWQLSALRGPRPVRRGVRAGQTYGHGV